MFESIRLLEIVLHISLLFVVLVNVIPPKFIKTSYLWYFQVLSTEWTALFLALGFGLSFLHASFIWFPYVLLTQSAFRKVKLLSATDIIPIRRLPFALIRNVIPFLPAPKMQATPKTETHLEYDSLLREGNKTLCIHIHGGGWKFGSSKQLSFIAQAFRQQDSDFISINYTKYPEKNIFEILQEVESTFLQLVQKYGKDKKIIVYGRSAGGYMALHLGNKFPDLITGIVSLYPITSFESLLKKQTPDLLGSSQLAQDLMGNMTNRVAELELNFENMHAKQKVLLVHGKNDPVVDFDHSDRAFEALRFRNVEAYYLKFDKATHGFDFAWNGYSMQTFRKVLRKFI